MTRVFNTEGPTTLIFFEVLRVSGKLMLRFVNSRYTTPLEVKRCPQEHLLRPGCCYAVEVRNLPLKDERWSWVWPVDADAYVEMTLADCVKLSSEFFREALPSSRGMTVHLNKTKSSLMEF